MQTSGIEIAPETVGHILGEENLRVPLSQRSYRWQTEHVEDLYKDINGVIVDQTVDEYFIGSIVGIKSHGTTFIYDGQQRLATTMVLIAAIRDHFYSSGDEETARLIEDESLISKDRKTHEIRAHFVLNAEDHQFFHDRILLRPGATKRGAAKPQRESHKRIEKAAKIAKDFIGTTIVSNLPAGQSSKNLHRWLDFIKEGSCLSIGYPCRPMNEPAYDEKPRWDEGNSNSTKNRRVPTPGTLRYPLRMTNVNLFTRS
jgi:hypothetical protein